MFKEKDYWIVDEKVGAVKYCSCGFSGNLPFCDNSHEGSKNKPYKIKVENPRRVKVCGCNKSNKLPYCDGRH